MSQHHERPFVSIISVNYNAAAVTCEMLQSLKKISYSQFEVIVVDNASTEDPSLIPARHPWITFIRNSANEGFAGGNNRGIEHAKGKYILLLNNDTEVTKDFLEPLVELMEQDATVGAVSPKIEFHHHPGILQFAGFNPINPYTTRGTAIGSMQKDDGRFDTSMPTARAHGAAMLFRKKITEEIGMLPELYFLYYEEMDYCKKMQDAGYRIWYCAESKIYHKESVSTGKESPMKLYYLTRNRILYQRRNAGKLQLIISILFLLCFTIPRNTITLFFSGKIIHLHAFYRGLIWNITHRNIHQLT
jgi:GT2 family glycosyltransferase